MLYNELDFLDRFAAAARAGFKAVEYLVPLRLRKELLAEKLQENGLEQVLHNLPAGDWAAGERGIACPRSRRRVPGRRRTRRSSTRRALGCTQVNCLAGIAPPGVDPTSAARRRSSTNLQVRRPRAEGGRHQAADRADQHARHPGLLPHAYAAGARHHRGGRLGQPVPAVRHLPHADHGRRSRADDRGAT